MTSGPQQGRAAAAPTGVGAPLVGDVPLDQLPLPTRLLNWAFARGLTTVGQVAVIGPEALMEQRGLGRLTVARARGPIEACFGVRWEDLAGREIATAEPVAAEPPVSAWDEACGAWPEELLAEEIGDVLLPPAARVRAEREGIRTLGDLATRSAAELQAAGWEAHAVEQLVAAIAAHQERAEARRRLAGEGLLPSWMALLGELTPKQRAIVVGRAGLEGQPKKLREIGRAFGFSGERARMVEAGALEKLRRERAWVRAVVRRVKAALSGGAQPLAALAADPWWAAIAARPPALDYLGERLLGGAARVIHLDGEPWLAPCSEDELDEAVEALLVAARQIPVPAPLSAFLALLGPHRAGFGETLTEQLRARLVASLRLQAASAEPLVLAVDANVGEAVVALLRASKTPLLGEEIAVRLGRQSVVSSTLLPPEVLHFGSGVLALAQHFPDMDAWMKRLVPPALRHMKREAPERQWLASELREALAVDAALAVPGWLTEWHLAALLRTSGRVRYLGRNRVALLGAPGQGERICYHAEMRRILREHGGPMACSELFAALRARTSIPESTAYSCLLRPEFLRCSADRVGLVERDLPGGAAAQARAAERVAALLERRGEAMSARRLHAEVRKLGGAHARWTEEMCTSALRGDGRFRHTRAGLELARREAGRGGPEA
jgi:hypothetical protein